MKDVLQKAFKTSFSPGSFKILGEKSEILDLAKGRIVLISAFFVLAYILVGARAVDLTLIQAPAPVNGGDYSRVETVKAAQEERGEAEIRADIVDRNGVLLATSLATESLYADPKIVQEPQKTAKALVKIFPDLTYGDVLQKLQEKKKRFVWVRRNMTPEEQSRVLRIGDPGLSFRTEYGRIYPQGRMASHIVGYTGIDGSGLSGVEKSFDRLLREEKEEPLALTIDVRLQHILRDQMSEAVRTFKARGGAGMIMDVRTGEVLAAVSLPDFDPHDPRQALKDDVINRFSLGVYELGSVFKIFTTAAALETGNVTLGSYFDASEPIKRGRFRISDYHPENRPLSVPEIFMYSSNIGTALMGEKVGTQALKSFYKDLGLFDPGKIEIGEVGAPIIPYPWREINTLTASYGHGIAVSPLQLISAVAAITGDGTEVRPTLILHSDEENEKLRNRETVRVVSPQTSHRMRQLMRLVVTDGTGQSADVPGYRVGGKTGTADMASGRGYDRNRRLSSFVGIFPVDAPRYAVYVMIEEPKGNKSTWGYATGGWVAAPAVGRIIAGMGPLTGVPVKNVPENEDISASLHRYLKKEETESAQGELVSY